MPSAESYFSDERRKPVMDAIAQAEKKTSGEIRLFIENHCPEDVLDRAAFLFKELKMNATKERNGVLFYLAMKSHKFAILGDAGINSKVPADFWDEIRKEMQRFFKEGDFVNGLITGVDRAGEALKTFFPYLKDDTDELSNEIVFGKRPETES